MPNFDCLTDEQLLESMIPSSAVKEMIATYGGVQQALLNATARELKTFPSIGTSRAKQLCYITELVKRLHSKLNPHQQQSESQKTFSQSAKKCKSSKSKNSVLSI